MATISDKFIRAIKLPKQGSKVHWDDDITGFGIRVTAAGCKAFVLRYSIHGTERRYTIGQFGQAPGFNSMAARLKALELKGKIAASQNRFDPAESFDPLEARSRANKAATIEQLAAEYLEKHAEKKKRPSSLRNDRQLLYTHILPRLKNLKIAAIGSRHIHDLHRAMSDTPYRANRTLALLSKMFNLAIQWEWCPRNPVKGIERYHEEKRDRWLSLEEIQRLTTELERHSNRRSAGAIRLLLLTGARRGEVLSARWEDIDFDRGAWRKPSAHTKQKRTEHVPLNEPALALLKEMSKKRVPGVPFIFPGDAEGKPLQEIKRTWADICRRAQLGNVRLHDLRHSFASHLASNGLSLPIIGRLLGHTQTSTTARYAHLADFALRDATNRFATIVGHAKPLDPSDAPSASKKKSARRTAA